MGKNLIWVTTRVNFRTPLVSHIFSNLFFVMNDVDFASYADGNTPFS